MKTRLAIGAALLSALAATPARAVPEPPTCAATRLTVALRHTGAAAGTVGGFVSFRNRGGRTCRLSGWPTLVAVATDGRTRTAVRRRSTMFGPNGPIHGVPTVVLRPGERAEAVFAAGDNPGEGQTTCPPPYRWLQVTPPGGTHVFTVSAWLTGLDAFLPSCTGVDVSFVVAQSALHHG